MIIVQGVILPKYDATSESTESAGDEDDICC